MNLFGFDISRSKKSKKQDSEILAANLADQPKSFVPPTSEDGSQAIAAGGYYGQFLDLDGDAAKSDVELIRKYRMSAEQPECDSAISDIVNETIVSDDDTGPISLNLDKLEQPASIKKEIKTEFDNLLRILNFKSNGSDIFRRWYVDGRLYYHIITDEDNPSNGIQELRAVDALKIRKVREIVEERDPSSGTKIVKVAREYFLYQEGGMQKTEVGVQVAKDSICYVPSGLLDSTRKKVLSHLHKAIKPVNQLRMMEDAQLIYRLARAPERRIFYIDVGNLPKGKAEEYLRSVMNQYRNKIVYNAQTGELVDDRKHMSMLEDFWLPRREGGRSTQIDTLPGAQTLNMDDILLFQKKLYRSLNVPIGRLETESGFNLGKSSEISRDEVKFQKFIDHLRLKFSVLFLELLKIQLILTGVITEDEWPEIKEFIQVDYRKDNHFSELKNGEILANRLALLDSIQPYVGEYYSKTWVKKNVLNMTDEEMEEMDDEISQEGSDIELQDQQTAELEAQAFGDPTGALPPPEDPRKPKKSGVGKKPGRK